MNVEIRPKNSDRDEGMKFLHKYLKFELYGGIRKILPEVVELSGSLKLSKNF